jgi:hypothetical protein
MEKRAGVMVRVDLIRLTDRRGAHKFRELTGQLPHRWPVAESDRHHDRMWRGAVRGSSVRVCVARQIMKSSSWRLWFLIALVVSLTGGQAVAQEAPTDAALRALPLTNYQSVTRLGFYSPGDGGRATYAPSGSACSLNNGNGDEGSEVKSADGKCWLADFGAGPPSVRVFGAVGDGVKSDATPLLSCLAFSVARHAACHLPAGVTLAVDDITVPSGATLVGAGVKSSTIRRIASSGSGNRVLHCNGCSNVTISDLGIDGNKANETVRSSIVNFRKYSSITIERVSIFGAKGGNGISLDNSSDQSAPSQVSTSTIADSMVSSNDANGILVTTTAYKLSLRNVSADTNGGYGFYAGPIGTSKSRADTLQDISIEGGQYSRNGNSGVAAQGFLVWAVSDIKINGVTANQNGSSGIVLQSDRGLVADSIANGNNTREVDGAGVLANCKGCEVSNVTINANGVRSGYGIDAGGASGIHIHGGTISNNVVGINIGGSTDSDIRGVHIISSKLAGVRANSIEASGDGFGIAGFTNNLSITDNTIVCPNSAGPWGIPYGILTQQGATNLKITGNHIEGCTLKNAIVSDLYSGQADNNVIRPPQNIGNTYYIVNAARDTLLIPDGLSDTVSLTGTNRFSRISRYSQASVGTGIGGIRVDIPGSGFVNRDPAIITGCSTNPTGVTVIADRAGHLTGLRLGTRGSGCTKPTVAFPHGMGQSLTIMVGAWQNTSSGVSLLVHPGNSLTIPGGGNITFLHGATSRIGANSLIKLKQTGGRYVEEKK